MKRLLDTNAYVELLKGNAEVASLVRSAEQLVFSMVVVGELLFGFRNGNRGIHAFPLVQKMRCGCRIQLNGP